MTVASRARTAAFNFEVKKDGLSQLQSGDWKVTFTASQQDMPSALLGAAMGTRYVCALCEKGDDEQPVQHKERQRWSEMPRVKQAGILCADPRFQKWVSAGNEGDAAEFVRNACGVDSRVALDNIERAGREWDLLVTEYWTVTGQLAERTG